MEAKETPDAAPDSDDGSSLNDQLERAAADTAPSEWLNAVQVARMIVEGVRQPHTTVRKYVRVVEGNLPGAFCDW